MVVGYFLNLVIIHWLIFSLTHVLTYLLTYLLPKAAPAQGQPFLNNNLNNNMFQNNALQQQRGINPDAFSGRLEYHSDMNYAKLKKIKEKQFQELHTDPTVNAYEAKLRKLIEGFTFLFNYLLAYLLTRSFVLDTYENVYSKYLDRSQNSLTTSVGGVAVKPKSSFPYLYNELNESVIEKRISELKGNVKQFKIKYKVVFMLLT